MPGILGLYDTPANDIVLDAVSRSAVFNEVIDQINQEFQPAVWQSPSEIDRRRIRERVDG